MMTANAGNFSGQAEIMPDPGEKVEFENWNRKNLTKKMNDITN